MHAFLRSILILMLVAATAPLAGAQEAPYRFDIGAGMGMNGYLGEASSSMFKHPGFTADAGMRYIPNARMAFRGMLSLQNLSGSVPEENLCKFVYIITGAPKLTRAVVTSAFIQAHCSFDDVEVPQRGVLVEEQSQRQTAKLQPLENEGTAAPSLDELLANSSIVI